MTDESSSTVESFVVNFAVGEAIERAVTAREEWSRALVVNDDHGITEAAEGLRSITSTSKRIDDARKTRKAPIIEAGRRLDGAFNPVIARLKAIESDTKRKVSAYHNAEQARLRELARAREEAAAAEQARQRALAEEARRQNDIDAAADATFAAEMSVAPPPEAPRKVQGISMTSRWHAEVTDLGLLILAAANDPERYLGLLEPNMPALNKLAVAHHGAVQVPGVKMVEETGVAVR